MSCHLHYTDGNKHIYTFYYLPYLLELLFWIDFVYSRRSKRKIPFRVRASAFEIVFLSWYPPYNFIFHIWFTRVWNHATWPTLQFDAFIIHLVFLSFRYICHVSSIRKFFVPFVQPCFTNYITCNWNIRVCSQNLRIPSDAFESEKVWTITRVMGMSLKWLCFA